VAVSTESREHDSMSATPQFMRETLLTRRLLLRDVVEDDAELLFDLDSDPEVMRYIGPRPESDLLSYRDRIRSVFLPRQAHPWHGIRIVLDRQSEEFLGWTFARPAIGSSIAQEIGWTRCDEIEVGFRFRRSSWGRGFATEAAEALFQVAFADPATAAVVACAHAENRASLRVLEKLGLKRIGEVLLPGDGRPTIKLARVR
jgi:ribosomal-protein-alanine N-acetyltransferase